MAKRLSRRGIKIHRNYTVEEVARALEVAKGTVLRWVKSSDLPAITDQRPFLILGSALAAFLDARRKPKVGCKANECYCFSCRTPREPAGGMADFVPLDARGGNLKAICCTCFGMMQKRVSLAQLSVLKTQLDLTITQGRSPLGKCHVPCLNDDLSERG
jgi:excisionase family DNA binding protein